MQVSKRVRGPHKMLSGAALCPPNKCTFKTCMTVATLVIKTVIKNVLQIVMKKVENNKMKCQTCAKGQKKVAGMDTVTIEKMEVLGDEIVVHVISALNKICRNEYIPYVNKVNICCHPKAPRTTELKQLHKAGNQAANVHKKNADQKSQNLDFRQ